MDASATDTEMLVYLVREGVWLALAMSAPIVVSAALVGLLVSALQAATQIGEHTLPFVPKVIAATVAIIACAPWIERQLHAFTLAAWSLIPRLGHGHG